MAEAAYRMVSNEKQEGSNIDHTYCIALFTQNEPLHQLNRHITQHAVDTGKDFDCNGCKMLTMKVKHLKDKLAVLAQQEKKETSQACIQMDLIAVTTQKNLQLMSKYEQALKEIHKWKVQCKTLQKLKSEPSTTPTKEADVSSRREVDKVYCQLAACCTERDQYKSEVEQLKQQISQMDSKMRQFRSEVEQLRKETRNTASASTSRDERECRVPMELEDDDGIMHAIYRKSHKRHKCPHSPELNPAPVKKPHVSVSETGVLPYGNYNNDHFTICEKDSTPNPNMAITGLERLTTGSTSTVSTQTTRAVMNIKTECGGYINVHAGQQIPDTNDYYYCNGTTTKMKLLHQSSVPAVDLDKKYYYKHFEELGVKVKHLENLLAATLVQQVKKKTSQAIQTDPISEPMQDSSRTQLVSQYEQVIKEVQILKHLYNTLQKQESKLGSTPAKKAKVQSMSEVDKMAIQVDRVVRQLDACCTERDLYKSEVEQLNQQNSQLESEKSQLRTEVEKLRVTQNTTSTNTSRDKSTKLWNLRMNVARLLTILSPDQNFGNCDADAFDDILQQVLNQK